MGSICGETSAHGVHSDHRKISTYQNHDHMFSGSYSRQVKSIGTYQFVIHPPGANISFYLITSRVPSWVVFPSDTCNRTRECLEQQLDLSYSQSPTQVADKQVHKCMVPRLAHSSAPNGVVGATKTREFSSSSSRCCPMDLIRRDTCRDLLPILLQTH